MGINWEGREFYWDGKDECAGLFGVAQPEETV
jgi:hypothetical protein